MPCGKNLAERKVTAEKTNNLSVEELQRMFDGIAGMS
jgi:hypothetical protein